MIDTFQIVEQTINDQLFTTIADEFDLSSGDITPAQQTALDKHVKEIAIITNQFANQNS